MMNDKTTARKELEDKVFDMLMQLDSETRNKILCAMQKQIHDCENAPKVV